MTPILYNIYTNNQPIPTQPSAKSFIYADDEALAIQGNNFEEVEEQESKINLTSGHTRLLPDKPSQTQLRYVPFIYEIDKQIRNSTSHGKEKYSSILLSLNTLR